jgi:hypothetical protein
LAIRRRGRGRCRRWGSSASDRGTTTTAPVEITRADERHDRVDVVSRGFLGLTVGCARCHDHKYDAIPTKDYYSLAGVFLNTSYHEYPLVPKSVVDEYTLQDKQIEKKEKLLEEFTRTESTQLGERWRSRRRNTWRRRGRCSASRRGRRQDRRRRETRLRAVRSLAQVPAKPPRFYPYLTKWQEMIKGGGSAAGGEDARRRVPDAALEVMFDRKEIKDENDIIIAKALVGTKKKEPGKLPSDFVTNDDFLSQLRPRAEKPAGGSQQSLDRRVPARSAGRFRPGAGAGPHQARPAGVSRMGSSSAS